MKTIYHFIAPLLALITMAACAELEISENPQNSNNELLQELSVTGKDFIFDGETRSTVTIGESGASFTWDEDDVIGIFPDKGDQVSFAMDEGAGTQTATFSGGGWALKSSAKYAAYYPHVYENRDLTAIPVSYLGQTQNGNANTDHIGAYDFMAAGVSTPENGAVAFDMQHLGCLVQLKITVPQPATLTSVKLVAETDAFALEGKVNIMADVPSIIPVTSAKEIELILENVATTKENQVATLYMMLPPMDLSEQTLKAVVESDKGTQEIELASKNFQAGKAYSLSGEMDSTDAGYKDGIVTLTKAGTIKSLLGDDWLNITSLKVVGPIDGDDVHCLRQMLGGNEFSDAEKGKLASLDLSGVMIVKGGNYYYNTSSFNYYTSNDVIGNFMFYKCANLKDIVLSNSLTSIGQYAFSGCI